MQKAEDGQRLASEILTACFQVIEGASHWVQQDAPEQLSDVLLVCLANISSFRSFAYTKR